MLVMWDQFNRVSQPKHYCHLELDKSLLWSTNLFTVECLAVSLACSHYYILAAAAAPTFLTSQSGSRHCQKVPCKVVHGWEDYRINIIHNINNYKPNIILIDEKKNTLQNKHQLRFFKKKTLKWGRKEADTALKDIDLLLSVSFKQK